MKKKHLGQHFLHDPKLLAKIAEASPAQHGDIVLEIGPGDGALTAAILNKGCRVIAIEYDAELIPVLQKRFPSQIESKQLQLVQADFLDTDIAEVLQGKAGTTVYHVIANIPYYITGAILRKLLSGGYQPHTASLIMQREVAERIVCRDGKQSLLSLSVSVYGSPRLEFRIPAGAFNPPPNVDSALLVVSNISRKNFITPHPNPLPRGEGEPETEELFFQLIHAGFSQRRKQLYKLVAHLVSREEFESWCATHSFPVDIRAEDVPMNVWIALVLCIVK